jgi:hypothetical protein
LSGSRNGAHRPNKDGNSEYPSHTVAHTLTPGGKRDKPPARRMSGSDILNL